MTQQLQNEILNEIITERIRQNKLVVQGKFEWTCANPTILPVFKLAVLAEEFGEVSHVVCDGLSTPPANVAELRKELIQVAAVCVAWVESLSLT